MKSLTVTQLLVFPSARSLKEQIELLQKHLDPALAEIVGSADFEVVNGDPIEDTIVALPIERVRELHVDVLQSPLQHERRILFLPQIELASIPAQNALLKLLEEPPRHIQFILTTTKLGAVIETIQSRSQIQHIQDQKAGSEAPAKARIPEQIQSVLTQFPAQKLTVSEVFQLSEEYKERAQAMSLMSELMQFLLQKVQEHPSPKLVQSLKAADTALQQLEKNVNCRLVIEAYLFQFVEGRHP